MASPGQQATGTSPFTGGPPSQSSPQNRFLAFIGNVFDVEMTAEEKMALEVLRRCASIPFVEGKPEHEEVNKNVVEGLSCEWDREGWFVYNNSNRNSTSGSSSSSCCCCYASLAIRGWYSNCLFFM